MVRLRVGLYDAVKTAFTKEDVSLSNILGFTSDNCSTMMGHAVKVLPSYFESFLKDLTSYFSRSSKRQNDFSMIRSVVGTKENKIPKLPQTKWLSCENVINIIIE
ncbi:Hypothetical predicted protein [Octopus vulgaris]|uniref:Uncharacterized protein n=1 Tax=Octopus vulgaris TaxID=6645 RepID=A0AA36ASV0_OCTVU|nr:Hypothetical predicted protein [Octopus vulgaris]